MYHRPDPLLPGDAVGIFLPSSPAREPFRGQGLRALREMGFRPREVGDVLSGEDFLARTPERSLADLQEFFADSEVKALWAGRGGYGSNYLLPLLDRLVIARPKIVVASSDVSYLLWYLLEQREMVVFYGPMVYGGLAAGAYDRDQVIAALTGNRPPLNFSGSIAVPGQRQGSARRRLPVQFRFPAGHAAPAGAEKQDPAARRRQRKAVPPGPHAVAMRAGGRVPPHPGAAAGGIPELFQGPRRKRDVLPALAAKIGRPAAFPSFTTCRSAMPGRPRCCRWG